MAVGTLINFLFVFVLGHRARARVWYDRYFGHDRPFLPIGASLDYIHEARVWDDRACALGRKPGSDVGNQTGEAH
jgi:hypothetical protein